MLDLRTRTPRRDRVRASAALDLLSSRAATEVPLGNRAGVLAAGRVLHDVGQAPWGGASPYGSGDLLVTVDAAPAAATRLRGTGFWNRESVRLDYADGPTRAEWGNRADGRIRSSLSSRNLYLRT